MDKNQTPKNTSIIGPALYFTMQFTHCSIPDKQFNWNKMWKGVKSEKSQVKEEEIKVLFKETAKICGEKYNETYFSESSFVVHKLLIRKGSDQFQPHQIPNLQLFWTLSPTVQIFCTRGADN